MFRITRIKKTFGGHVFTERCSLIVRDLEKYRKTIKADEVDFVYETI